MTKSRRNIPTRRLHHLLLLIIILLLSQQWVALHSHGFVSPLLQLHSSWKMRQYQYQHEHCLSKIISYSHLGVPITRSLYNSRNPNGNCNDHDEAAAHPSASLRVGIIGAGSIAFGTASLAASLGHDPMIWSPSGAGTKELVEGAITAAATSSKTTPTPGNDDLLQTTSDHATIAVDSTILSSEIQSTGALAHSFNVRIARSPKELVQFNDNVLVLALPVNGHKQVMEELAPHIIELVMKRQEQGQQHNMSKEDRDGSSSLMHIIISSHASLGAVYFMQLLREERTKYLQKIDQSKSEKISKVKQHTEKDFDTEIDIGVRITAWGTTAITARKTSGSSVNILTLRQSVDYCTVPSIPESEESFQPTTGNNYEPSTIMSRQELLADGYNLCTTLFGPRFKLRKGGLLAISLSNLNPQNHLGIVLGNMSRMDPPPPPPPPVGMELESKTTPDTTIKPWHQGKNITPNVGRLMEALDRERLDIAEALDIDVRTIYQHFSWSFHVPMETPVMPENESTDSSSITEMRPLTVSEMNQQMHHYLDTDVLGPSSPDSRYVLEDVPYGLVLTVILGRLVDRPAILHEAGIRIASAMYGRDFMVENELLQGLGLIINEGGSIPSLERWRSMAYSGYFRDG